MTGVTTRMGKSDHFSGLQNFAEFQEKIGQRISPDVTLGSGHGLIRYNMIKI